MNFQQMSGQISAQVPNQSGTSLPGLPQQNGNPSPMQMQSPSVHRTIPNMEFELVKVRRTISRRM